MNATATISSNQKKELPSTSLAIKAIGDFWTIPTPPAKSVTHVVVPTEIAPLLQKVVPLGASLDRRPTPDGVCSPDLLMLLSSKLGQPGNLCYYKYQNGQLTLSSTGLEEFNIVDVAVCNRPKDGSISATNTDWQLVVATPTETFLWSLATQKKVFSFYLGSLRPRQVFCSPDGKSFVFPTFGAVLSISLNGNSDDRSSPIRIPVGNTVESRWSIAFHPRKPLFYLVKVEKQDSVDSGVRGVVNYGSGKYTPISTAVGMSADRRPRSGCLSVAEVEDWPRCVTVGDGVSEAHICFAGLQGKASTSHTNDCRIPTRKISPGGINVKFLDYLDDKHILAGNPNTCWVTELTNPGLPTCVGTLTPRKVGTIQFVGKWGGQILIVGTPPVLLPEQPF